jgi:amino acid adenylation domain-containing protein
MTRTDHLTPGVSATLLESIAAVAAASPERVAVSAPDGSLTYGELTLRTDRLARRLLALGVEPGALVAQCLARSASLVVGALATFKAGAAYLATDPAYPDERLSWMFHDAGSSVVITDRANAPRLSGDERAIVVLAGAGELLGDAGAPQKGAPADGSQPAVTALGGELAYVVYTSGSTGQPKGVMVEHASLLNLVRWHQAAFGLTGADRCTQIASPGFDAAVWEIWPALAAGATILVVPDALRNDPAELRDWLVREGVTVAFLPTALAELAIGLPWPAESRLRHMLTGGDALTRRPPPGLPFELVNNYGLSETAVVATSGVVAPDGDAPPSIGRAITGVQVEIVDADLEPLAPGSVGELVVRGVALARGYLGRPELTAERFVVDGRGRLYRTSDRARLNDDQEVEFLGRLDDQLSIRGFRVEPGEVIAALSAHPVVETAAALALGASSAERQLVAYLVATDGERPAREQLDEFLGARLPDYMVPSRYVWLDSLPLTAHGKVDREALAALAADTKQQLSTQADVEQLITGVVAELLGVPAVAPDQNFFVLGGHSMLGAQLIVRLEDLFGAVVSLRYLFDHPTAAELALEVERQLAAAAAAPPQDTQPRTVELASGQ